MVTGNPTGDAISEPSGGTAVADAWRCATIMWSGDAASAALGMTIEDVGPGRARVSMRVRPDMVNGWDLCHGGLIASLADSTFALACNSYGVVTVAAGFEVDFLEPARLGDTLIAEATERARRGRAGLYDVTVRRGDQVIAEFRGRSRSLDRTIGQDGSRPPTRSAGHAPEEVDHE